MNFSELDLYEKLQSAHPGEAIYFDSVTPEEMDSAVKSLSLRKRSLGSQMAFQKPDSPDMLSGIPSALTDSFDLGEYVHVDVSWWGLTVSLDHEAVNFLLTAGSGVSAVLVAIGVAAWVAAIVAGLMGILKAVDQGNGVNVYITWIAAFWVAPR